MKVTLGELRSTINEAIKRADVDRVASVLANAASKAGARVTTDVDASGGMHNLFVRLVSGDADATEQALSDVASTMGWSLLTRSEKRGTVWWFEPAATTKGAIQASKLPAVLWHTTLAQNVDSILADGMMPRQRTVPGTTRRYEPRVYLAADPSGAKATASQPGDWAMLRIDRAKLPKGMKFYVDQEFGHRKDGTPIAVYTLDAIPASAISRA